MEKEERDLDNCWFSINEYTKEELDDFLNQKNVIVHVAGDQVLGPFFFATYYKGDGFSIQDGFGGILRDEAITHWRHVPELPY